MKRILLVASLITLSFLSSKAQFHFGAGINAGIPVGDVSDISSFVAGLEIQGERNFSEKFSGIVTTGYSHFFPKDLGGIKLKFGAIPVLAGVRIYPSESFFIGAQAGYSFFTGDATKGGFSYKPQVGYNGEGFQIALGYNAITRNSVTTGWLGLSGILKFGGK